MDDLCILPCDSIYDSAAVVQNIPRSNALNSDAFLVVKNRRQWREFFEDKIDSFSNTQWKRLWNEGAAYLALVNNKSEEVWGIPCDQIC